MEIDANQLKGGMKLEIDKVPYHVTSCQIVKPGKGQAFTRTKLKNLKTGRVVEKTFKANEKLTIADVNETKMRLLYVDEEDAHFMDDSSYEQITLPLSLFDSSWLKEETLYDIVFYNGEAVDITPPNFMELKVIETDPGVRGDTASGKVLKPAKLETGAEVQIPIFIESGEVIKVDTRTSEYVCRAS